MSSHDESSNTQKRRRRSLRVPVDEVPRPGAAEAAPFDGTRTVEIPAFDDGDGDMARSTLETSAQAPGSADGPADDALSAGDALSAELDLDIDHFEPATTVVVLSEVEDEEEPAQPVGEDPESYPSVEVDVETDLVDGRLGSEPPTGRLSDRSPPIALPTADEAVADGPVDDEPVAAAPSVKEHGAGAVGVVADDAGADGAGADGVVADGVVAAGAGADGAGADDAGADGVVADGVVADGVVADGVVADGVVADGVVADGVVADGAGADGVGADGARADGARVDGVAAGGVAAEKEPPRRRPSVRPAVQVVVHRVVAVASSSTSAPPPEEDSDETELSVETAPGTELAYDFDEPDIVVEAGEPDSEDGLEELDVAAELSVEDLSVEDESGADAEGAHAEVSELAAEPTRRVRRRPSQERMPPEELSVVDAEDLLLEDSDEILIPETDDDDDLVLSGAKQPPKTQELTLPEEDEEAEELIVPEAEGLLEEDEPAGESTGAAQAPGPPTKRPSKPLPPAGPPAKAAPPPPPPDVEAKAAPPAAPPVAPPAGGPAGAPASLADAAPVTARRKRVRRKWFEELFNDDYLRTVPIPHPKTIIRQCDFIEQRFGLAPGATILDVGCGLGLHAVELTRRGYLVVGLDLSLPMLSRAADEAQDCGFKINFLHADIREMNFDGAFDAVLCWNTTFGYFDDETNKLVVERLYKALKPRGLLLLDVVNRDYVLQGQPNLVWFEGDGCVVMEETKMNYIASRLEVKRTVILDNGRQRDSVYSLRLYALHELGQILHLQGFRVVELTGREAHPGVFFGAASPKLIILAERRPQGPPARPSAAPAAHEADPSTESSDPSSEPTDPEAAAPLSESAEIGVELPSTEVALEAHLESEPPPISASDLEEAELAEAELASAELATAELEGELSEEVLEAEELEDDDLSDEELADESE